MSTAVDKLKHPSLNDDYVGSLAEGPERSEGRSRHLFSHTDKGEFEDGFSPVPRRLRWVEISYVRIPHASNSSIANSTPGMFMYHLQLDQGQSAGSVTKPLVTGFLWQYSIFCFTASGDLQL